MYKNFKQILQKAKTQGKKTLCIAVADDKDVLISAKLALDAQMVDCLLVGDENKIKPLLREVGLTENISIIDEPDESLALAKAVLLVRDGKADILMKGLVNTSDFLRAVLNYEAGLRTNRLLSHLTAYEIPGTEKVVFHADTGMNVAPTLEEKAQILTNSLLALESLGIKNPHVAALAANEKVSRKIPATADAQALVEMNERGMFPPMVIEGPIAMDVALDPVAAAHKGISSKISGKVDLFFVPTIEAGNIMGKALVYYAKVKMAGVVLGALKPIVLTSRAETGEGKLNSIALACLLSSDTVQKSMVI